MNHTTTRLLVEAGGISFTSSLAGFVIDSLNDIAVWLLVMLTVILADLVMSIYKIIKVRERKTEKGQKLTAEDKVRWSKGLRDTMAKIATYFAFVVAMVFVANASHIESLHIYGCMAVIFGESLSIVGNWCKAHGYNFDKNRFINWGLSKATLPEGVITDEKETKKKK